MQHHADEYVLPNSPQLGRRPFVLIDGVEVTEPYTLRGENLIRRYHKGGRRIYLKRSVIRVHLALGGRKYVR